MGFFDELDIRSRAAALGAKPCRYDASHPVFQCWSDRIALAWRHQQDGEHAECTAWVKDADRYSGAR